MENETEPTVHVIGLGGVGFYCYLALLRAVDASRLAGWDADNLRGGLGHARLPVASPDTMKADLVRGFARVSMGDKPGTTHKAMFTGAECKAGDIVVDCTDMSTDKREVMYKAIKANGARYIRASYDGAASTIVVAEGLPLRTEGAEGGSGYDAVPSMALSFAAGGIAAECVRLVLANPAVYVENQVSLAEWLTKIPAAA
jgi:hypothetical protein